MALAFLLLLAGAGLAEAGRQNHPDAKASWGRKGHGKHQDHRSEQQHYGHYYPKRDDSRNSSRRRRRQSKSDSGSPKGRMGSQKPAEAKESPGYLEYRQQKFEAQQWQQRRPQAQALALCLEERDCKSCRHKALSSLLFLLYQVVGPLHQR